MFIEDFLSLNLLLKKSRGEHLRLPDFISTPSLKYPADPLLFHAFLPAFQQNYKR